jgi:glucose/arabinose dehydrogenase
MHSRISGIVVPLSALFVLSCGSEPMITEDELNSLIYLPPGFVIEEYAEVPNARSMTLSDNGVLYVGTRQDRFYAVRDRDGDGTGERVDIVAAELNQPNGVAWRDGSLFVAEVSRVTRYDDIDNRIVNPPPPVVVREDYPSDRHHGWKYIAFGPDGYLYVPVGAPCNVCDEDNEIYASITRILPDGTDRSIVAHGVRNTVGFTWDPLGNDLWFTDNGRDQLGDDLPPDELNHLTEPGQHFGFPFCHGGDIVDPDFGTDGACASYRAPAQRLGPHVASLGMLFYTGEQFPAEYRNQIFIAEHGSWNRTAKIGYRISLVRLDENRTATSYEAFASGWLLGDETVVGRPVDLLQMPDGSILLSDDYGGKIYRISYSG